MNDTIGVGALIPSVFGGVATDKIVTTVKGKIIRATTLEPDLKDDGAVKILFTDNSSLVVWDSGRSCCESRYLHTDDDLTKVDGAEFRGLEVLDAPNAGDTNGDIHEVQFLQINTSLGPLTLETHNKHNGCYGGFYVQAEFVEAIIIPSEPPVIEKGA